MGRLSAYAKNRILKLRFKKNKRIIHIVEILRNDDNIKVSRQAVSTFLKKYLETNSIYDKPRTGRKRKLTQEEIQLIGQVTRLNRDITARAIKEYLNLNVSTYTILRATKLFEWNKINPNSNDSKKAAALERQLNGSGSGPDGQPSGIKRRRSNSATGALKIKKNKRKLSSSGNINNNNEESINLAAKQAAEATKSAVKLSNLNNDEQHIEETINESKKEISLTNKEDIALSAETNADNKNESSLNLNESTDLVEIEKIQEKLLSCNQTTPEQASKTEQNKLEKDHLKYEKSKSSKSHKNANSIPELEKVDLNLMGHRELLILKNLSCSPMSFATKILFKIFKIEELHGHNVSGKTLNKNLKAKLPLDPIRIGYIKYLVEKYYDEKECKEMLSGATSNKQDLWKSCHTAINKSILISERKSQAAAAAGKPFNISSNDLSILNDDKLEQPTSSTANASDQVAKSTNNHKTKYKNRKSNDSDNDSSDSNDDSMSSTEIIKLVMSAKKSSKNNSSAKNTPKKQLHNRKNKLNSSDDEEDSSDSDEFLSFSDDDDDNEDEEEEDDDGDEDASSDDADSDLINKSKKTSTGINIKKSIQNLAKKIPANKKQMSSKSTARNKTELSQDQQERRRSQRQRKPTYKLNSSEYDDDTDDSSDLENSNDDDDDDDDDDHFVEHFNKKKAATSIKETAETEEENPNEIELIQNIEKRSTNTQKQTSPLKLAEITAVTTINKRAISDGAEQDLKKKESFDSNEKSITKDDQTTKLQSDTSSTSLSSEALAAANIAAAMKKRFVVVAAVPSPPPLPPQTIIQHVSSPVHSPIKASPTVKTTTTKSNEDVVNNDNNNNNSEKNESQVTQSNEVNSDSAISYTNNVVDKKVTVVASKNSAQVKKSTGRNKLSIVVDSQTKSTKTNDNNNENQEQFNNNNNKKGQETQPDDSMNTAKTSNTKKGGVTSKLNKTTSQIKKESNENLERRTTRSSNRSLSKI